VLDLDVWCCALRVPCCVSKVRHSKLRQFVMKYILALDQGTTSSRAIVFDHHGTVRSLAQKEFPQYYPRPGWVEHDPNEIWSSQSAVAVEALSRLGLNASDVAALGITNQRETTVLWHRATGEPICPAIVWQDRRTADLCAALKAEGQEPLFRERTGLLLDPYFAGTKLKWLLDHVPDARARAEHGELAFGTVDAWLVWKLSQGRVHLTDATNAARTLLFNIHTCRWDEDLLRALDIPPSVLPRVVSCSEVYAEVAEKSFLSGVPIAGMAGDQHAALFGQTCFKTGMAKNTYGTGCFVLLTTGSEPRVSQNNLLTTVAWQRAARTEYALEGSIFIAGAVVQWLRDGLGLIRHSNDVEALAATVPDNGGVFFVPAFVGLGAPHWDPHARGTLVGLTRGSNAAHLARAALESIAFQSADVLHAMQRDAGIPLKELRVDGGASRNDLLLQFQADLLQVPVLRPRVTETTALGAAYLAGLAVGYWDGLEAVSQHWTLDRRFEPQRSASEMAALQAEWARAVERASDWACPGIL
jgi:glycerol kinase